MIQRMTAGLLALICVYSTHGFAEAEPFDKFIIKQSQMLIEALESRELVGLEFFTISAGNALENQLGHAGVRIVDGDAYPLNDIVISFGALAGGDGAMKYFRGVNGSYPLYPSLTVLSRELRVLNYDGMRFFDRYPLTLSKDQLKKFVAALKVWVQNPEQSPRYTFFDKNCGFGLFYLLNQAGLTSYTQALIPTGIAESLRLSALSFFPAIRSESPAAVVSRLDDPDKFAAETQKMSLSELILLTTSEKELSRAHFVMVRDLVQQRLAQGEVMPFLHQLYKVEAGPRCIYDIDQIEACAQQTPAEYKKELSSIALTLKTRANLMKAPAQHVQKLQDHIRSKNFKVLERISAS